MAGLLIVCSVLLASTWSTDAASDRVTDWLNDQAKFGTEGLRWGAVEMHPRLSASAMYDDNIVFNPADKQDDFIYIVSPGVALGAGNFLLEADRYIKLDYAPSFWFFQEETQYNTVDHDAQLSGAWDFDKLAVKLQQDFIDSSANMIEYGSRVEQRLYLTQLSLKFPLTGKTDIEVMGRQMINDYDALIDNQEWMGHVFLDYRYSPKLTLGAGGGGGYRNVQVGPSQVFEQFLLRARYALAWKTELNATAGAETAQYEGGEQHLGPVASLGITWLPFNQTRIGLDGFIRDQTSAYLAGRNYTVAGFRAHARQRFLRKMFFTVGGGYENRSYHAVVENVSEDRQDDYFYGRFNWEWHVTKHWILGASYLHRNNSSNVLPFDNNVVSVQSAFTF